MYMYLTLIRAEHIIGVVTQLLLELLHSRMDPKLQD